MTITYRHDETGPAHTMFTVFINGVNSGRLTMTHTEAFAYITVQQAAENRMLGNHVILSGNWQGGQLG